MPNKQKIQLALQIIAACLKPNTVYCTWWDRILDFTIRLVGQNQMTFLPHRYGDGTYFSYHWINSRMPVALTEQEMQEIIETINKGKLKEFHGYFADEIPTWDDPAEVSKKGCAVVVFQSPKA